MGNVHLRCLLGEVACWKFLLGEGGQKHSGAWEVASRNRSWQETAAVSMEVWGAGCPRRNWEGKVGRCPVLGTKTWPVSLGEVRWSSCGLGVIPARAKQSPRAFQDQFWGALAGQGTTGHTCYVCKASPARGSKERSPSGTLMKKFSWKAAPPPALSLPPRSRWSQEDQFGSWP